jgi:hypothetical protein
VKVWVERSDRIGQSCFYAHSRESKSGCGYELDRHKLNPLLSMIINGRRGLRAHMKLRHWKNSNCFVQNALCEPTIINIQLSSSIAMYQMLSFTSLFHVTSAISAANSLLGLNEIFKTCWYSLDLNSYKTESTQYLMFCVFLNMAVVRGGGDNISYFQQQFHTGINRKIKLLKSHKNVVLQPVSFYMQIIALK